MEELSPDSCEHESGNSHDDLELEVYERSQKYEYNTASMSIFQPWSLEGEKLENDSFTCLKNMCIKVEDQVTDTSQSKEENQHVYGGSYETESAIGQTGDESGNDWLASLIKQEDDFQIKQESDSELPNKNLTEERQSSKCEPMLLSEDDLEQYAFESLVRVLPNMNIQPVNTRENQLAILRGAITYIRELESTSEDTESDITDERGLTRLDTAAGPLLAFGQDPEPKRPKNGFIRFSIKNRRQISLDNPGVDNREISRVLGCKWEQLTQEEKKPYEEEFMVEMNKRRKMDPNWRYCGMKRRFLEDLVEPMPSRLRPRDQLRSKIEVSKLKRSYRKRQLLPAPMFKWAQCDNCHTWRRLPSDTDMDLLPTQWYCDYNPDPNNNHCLESEEPYTVPVCEAHPLAHAVTYDTTRQNSGPPPTQDITAASNVQIWNQGPCSSTNETTVTHFFPGAQAAAVDCFSSFSRFRWQLEGDDQLSQKRVGVFGSLPGVYDDMMHDPGVGLFFQ